MKARAIVALDVSSLPMAMRVVEQLGDACDFYKIGSELFIAEGRAAVDMLHAAGKSVFLDLKLHDIPNTVRGAARRAASLGVELLTVHASGGAAMVEAAVQGAGEECGVLAVTVLTSLDAASLGGAWGRPITDLQSEVLRLADVAQRARALGIVCGGAEARLVSDRYGDALALLVPGIRLQGGDSHDQARVVTPREAVAAGARYLVVGRAVTAAPDPVAALARVAAAL